MFLTVHASIGALLGDVIDQPYTAGFAGLLSHFIFDSVPHGDEILGKRMVERGQKRWIGVLFVLDFLTAFCILSLFYVSGIIQNPYAAFVGALGAVLPDGLVGLSEISRKKFLPDFQRFHDASHRLLRNPIHPFMGYLVQVSLFILVWLVIVWL